MKYPFDYSREKSLILKETRGVDFEDVISAFENRKLITEMSHPRQDKYPKQRIFIVEINKYVYVVPYVIDQKRKVRFLKTIYPNRKLTKKYLGKIK